MVDLNTGRPLSYTQRTKLLDCFTYVNAIGFSYPIFNQKSIKDLLPVEINQLWQKIGKILQDSTTSPQEKLVAHLTAIAILRQVMHRTSSKENPIFPDSTQILELIISVAFGNGNIGLEIPTGEGKSIIEAIRAAMYTLSGKEAVISTPRLSTAESNLQKFADFFRYLDIPLAKKTITEHSSMEDFVPKGIHYTAPNEFGLFIMGKQKLDEYYSRFKNTHLIISEFDHTAKNLTRMRLSDVVDETEEDKKVSAIAWIYRLVNDFFEEGNEYTDEDEIDALKIYIQNHITLKQKQQLETLKISDDRLIRWLNAAKTLPTLQKDVDYIVACQTENSAEGKKEFYIIQILDHGEPSKTSEYDHAVQQMLCDNLNKQLDNTDPQKKLPRYKISPEGMVTASLTYANLINLMGRRNQLFVTSATLGSKEQTKKFATEFNLVTMIRVPHHQAEHRDRQVFLDIDEKAREQRVLKDIKAELDKRSPRGILLRPKDIAEADKWYTAIKKHFAGHPKVNTLQLYTGKDAIRDHFLTKKTSILYEKQDKTIDQQATKQAGMSGTITISTLMGRETDIQPRDAEGNQHPRGLFSLQTYLSHYDEQEQAAGRVGRRGTFGTAWLYVTVEELAHFEKTIEGEVKPTRLSVQKRIKHAQHIMTKEEIWKLKLHNIAGNYLHDLYEYFLSLHARLDKNQRKIFHMEWALLLTEIEESWLDILEENEITDKLINEEKLTNCTNGYLALLKKKCQVITSKYTELRSSNELVEIPEAPSFEPEKNVVPTGSPTLEPVIPPTLSLPDSDEITKICDKFSTLINTVLEVDIPKNKLTDVEKIQAFRKKLSLPDDISNPKDVRDLLQKTITEFLQRYDQQYFNSPQCNEKFKALLSSHHHLMQLFDNLDISPELKNNICEQMSAYYLNSLQNSYTIGTTSPIFAYHTQFKFWQSIYNWFSFKIPEEKCNNFQQEIMKDVIHEIKTYKHAWFRSKDREDTYKAFKKTLTGQQNLSMLLGILITEREKALTTDMHINEERKKSYISLLQRNISGSRYQKLLDAAMTKVVLALDVTGEKHVLQNYSTQMQQHIEHLLGLIPQPSHKSFFLNPKKAIKEIYKIPLGKDQESIVNILIKKSLLFDYTRVPPFKNTDFQEETKGKDRDEPDTLSQ